MYNIFEADSTLFDDNGLLKASKLGPLILGMLISSDWLGCKRTFSINILGWITRSNIMIYFIEFIVVLHVFSKIVLVD